jgi:hypothetical protein
MANILVRTVGAAAMLAAGTFMAVPAQAAPALSGADIQAAAAKLNGIQDVQFVFGGRRYCWYDGGWHGPGWYWCGYAWRRGFGWGGGYGWHGWRGGHRGPRGGFRGPRGGFDGHIGRPHRGGGHIGGGRDRGGAHVGGGGSRGGHGGGHRR